MTHSSKTGLKHFLVEDELLKFLTVSVSFFFDLGPVVDVSWICYYLKFFIIN